MTSTINLDKLSRQERLKQVIQDVKEGKHFSAFDLAVQYDVSLNVIYRDISALRDGKYIPEDWTFEKRVPFNADSVLESDIIANQDPMRSGS